MAGTRIRRRTALALAVLLAASACTANDAPVPPAGGQFQFVSPGGQTRIFYDGPDRGVVTGLSGESLTEPGRQISLADYQGKVVVLNLWGVFCPPCRSEVDDLERVYQQTKDKGVQMLGIDLRDDIRSQPADFVRDRGLTYPSIYDPPGRSLLALKGYPRNTVPSTIVLDRRHRVAAIFLTEIRDVDLLPVVTRIAEET